MDDSRTMPAVTHHRTDSRAVGVGLLIVTSLLWSLGGLGLKASRLPPVEFAFYRALAAAITMLPFLPFSRGGRPAAGWLLFSATLYTVVVSFVMSAMHAGTAASGILLQYTSPVFCALFAWIFQRRWFGRRTLAAMFMAGVGIGVMVFGGSGVSALSAVYGLISGIAFGGLALVLERLERSAGGKANPYLIVFCNNLGASLLLLPICMGNGQLSLELWQAGIVGATGAIQLAIPYVLFQGALRRVSPVDASLLILLEPLFNPLWVAIGVGERPDAATLVGGVAILSALVLEATKRSDDAG